MNTCNDLLYCGNTQICYDFFKSLNFKYGGFMRLHSRHNGQSICLIFNDLM